MGPRGKDADGKVLVVGDKIEARYKGKGTRWFKGSISAVKVEDGVTLFIKQRYKTQDAKGKTYKQIRVDEHGKRHMSITGAKIVPYNLPEVEAARQNNRTVFLTEGEKAADALKSIGAG